MGSLHVALETRFLRKKVIFCDSARLLLLSGYDRDYDGRREFSYPRIVSAKKLAPFSDPLYIAVMDCHFPDQK